MGILKDLLRKRTRRSSLTFEELKTPVCECEAVMNNKTLTYVSEEPELKTMKPLMSLQDLGVNVTPYLDTIQKSSLLSWQKIELRAKGKKLLEATISRRIFRYPYSFLSAKTQWQDSNRRHRFDWQRWQTPSWLVLMSFNSSFEKIASFDSSK